MEVGCVIGRFQVETLHEGHRYLINEAFRHHKKVIIFVGCPPISGTKYDPLDFPTADTRDGLFENRHVLVVTGTRVEQQALRTGADEIRVGARAGEYARILA